VPSYDRRAGVARTVSTLSLRVGLVGLDTSHAPTFTKILHDPYDPFHIPGARVVAAYAGGSPDMDISISRVGAFTSELRDKYGVEIVDTPAKVAEASDVVLILASDGRVHPALFRAVVGLGKPTFVDKPFAISVADAEDMFKAAREAGTRVFAASAFRYADGLVNALNTIRATGERVKACVVRCSMPIQETQGRHFWYGIHGAEMLIAAMGCGVREVEASGSDEQDRISVWHRDGRESSIVGSRSDGAFHITLTTDSKQLSIDLTPSIPSLSARLLRTVLDVLTGDKFPRLWGATAAGSVSGNRPGQELDPAADETIEIVRLLDAAQRSHASQQRVAIS
jgi:predicted dehydrogenase